MTSGGEPLLQTVHASCVLAGTVGILIRGSSGSGKSVLSALIVEAAAAKGHFSAHVSDDRTALRARFGLLVATPAPALAGKLEVRGLGIIDVPHVPETVVRLVADLVPAQEFERLPPEESQTVELNGVHLPRVFLEEGQLPGNLLRVRWALRGLFPKSPDYI